MVKCPGCGVIHLVADRKGWFGEPGSVEDFLSEKGESVLKRAAIKAPETGMGGTIEVTEEELRGWSAKGVGAGEEEGVSLASGGGGDAAAAADRESSRLSSAAAVVAEEKQAKTK